MIDAVDTDDRNAQLGSLCAGGDKLADFHSPCGYPTIYGATQPDSFVNEEWFGLFRVKRPCDDNVDQIEPREAWYRIKFVWKEGGCLLHDASFKTPYEPVYNESEYPLCGAALASTRRQWNFSAVAAGVEGYPFSCHVMHVLHQQDPTLCPPVPAHMNDTSVTFVQQHANWTDTPPKCAVVADPMNIITPLVVLFIALTMYSKNKYKLLQVYHLQVRKPLAQMLRGGVCFRFVAFAIGSLIMAAGSSLAGLALGTVCGEVLRAVVQNPNDAVLTVPPYRGSWSSGGGVVGALIGGLLGLIGALAYAWWRSCRRSRAPSHAGQRPAPRAAAEKAGSSQGREASSRRRKEHAAHSELAELFEDSAAPTLLLHPIALLKEHPSQRLLITPDRLHEYVMPVGAHLARIFGFQTAQLKQRGVSLEEVPSNVACQVDNVCSLLVNRMQRARLQGMDSAFHAAVHELHDKIFGNYRHWRGHLGLPAEDSDTAPKRRPSSPHASYDDLATNEQLHELMLFHLIWGEAANLRHTPECLCFIFYCARQRLHFPPATAGALLLTRLCEYQCAPAAADDFLRTIVTPAYKMLAHEILGRKADKINERVMYDVSSALSN